MNEDLGRLDTEAIDPRFSKIDTLSTIDLLTVFNENDKSVIEGVARVLPSIAEAITVITKRIESGGRLVYVGAGTSGRLGVLDAAECIPTFSLEDGVVVALIAGGDTALRTGIEGAEDVLDGALADLKKMNFSSKDALVGVAASGRTPYVIGALQYAKKLGAAAIALSCNLDVESSKFADIAIEINTGAEILAGSTRLKAGTAQKLVLNMISTVSMINLGKTYGNLMVDLQVSNVKLRDRAIRIIQAATGCDGRRAQDALREARDQVKVAIVMILLDISADKALASLKASGSRVRSALGKPMNT
ncbi:MAG: N-acetylmuramic acid 6-phosphate etherase [Actinobacteria bacterium]|nr:N-acetylmuramic acid 6-phosphate etherase [Actinomycetota bacterium]